jgi:hypothetical protein
MTSDAGELECAGKGDLLALKQFLGGLDKAPVINADRVNKGMLTYADVC